jgi:hypothetical protein
MTYMLKRDQYFGALDAVDAEEKMRKGQMKPAEAVRYLIEKCRITYGAANNAVYSYRIERGLIR